jgi:hypothetical protein
MGRGEVPIFRSKKKKKKGFHHTKLFEDIPIQTVEALRFARG